MRFHMLQNAQTALDFLRYKKIKLVNIRAEDIVDGNPKLTLGLIWTIILHFQVRFLFLSVNSNYLHTYVYTYIRNLYSHYIQKFISSIKKDPPLSVVFVL